MVPAENAVCSCYLALDKGALVWDPCPHILIVPIDHYGGTSTIPGACLLEIESYVGALRTYYAAQGEHLVVRKHARLRFIYSFYARIADYLEPRP